VLEKADTQERNQLLKIFGSKNTADWELKEALGIISGLGIEEEIRTLAESYISHALKSLDAYGDSEPKKALQTSADFIAKRSL
jgi:geranylgeranyl pyrophosphate synthase